MTKALILVSWLLGIVAAGAAEPVVAFTRDPLALPLPNGAAPAFWRLAPTSFPVLRTHPTALRLRAVTPPESAPVLAPTQFEADGPDTAEGTLWALLPHDQAALPWKLEPAPASPPPALTAQFDSVSGRWTVREGDRPLLVYNYHTNHPGDLRTNIHPDNLKYAQPRGDYLHPLFGLDGEELTRDWSLDHPHHRGIYWAWPEVECSAGRGDLHALQRVFARPTGPAYASSGPLFARIQASNVWLWEDRDPIVREQVTLRVWAADNGSRRIDLEFRFTALREPVTIARRETRLYGGLNLRFGPVAQQNILCRTADTLATPRPAWARLSGIFPGGTVLSSVAMLQHPANPDYPGDWVQYPELNWLQPTFPAAGRRYPLSKDRPLVLQYRLWIHRGQVSESELDRQWSAYTNPPRANQQP